VATSLAITLTLFTKYTAFVILPVLFTVFAAMYISRLPVPRLQVVRTFVLMAFLPVVTLSLYLISNVSRYHNPLPWNTALRDPSMIQPHDTPAMTFFSFKPWETIDVPIIVPGRMHSFWTLVYTGMWFDNEPKFLYYLVPDSSLWKSYYAWLSGNRSFPGLGGLMSGFTRIVGASLVALGLFPLLLLGNGIYNYSAGNWKSGSPGIQLSIFAALLLSNIAVIVALAIRLPVFSAAKASYFLNAMPAFSVFLGLGLTSSEKHESFRRTVTIIFAVLFAAVTLHVLQLCYGLIGKSG